MPVGEYGFSPLCLLMVLIESLRCLRNNDVIVSIEWTGADCWIYVTEMVSLRLHFRRFILLRANIF